MPWLLADSIAPALHSTQWGDTQWGEQTAWIVGLISFLLLVDLIFRIVDRFKAKPPLNQQFASRDALDIERKDREQDFAALTARVDRMDTRISELRTELSAGVKAECQRIYEKIDATNSHILTIAASFNNAIQDLERAIGVLEGRTSETRAKSRA